MLPERPLDFFLCLLGTQREGREIVHFGVGVVADLFVNVKTEGKVIEEKSAR